MGLWPFFQKDKAGAKDVKPLLCRQLPEIIPAKESDDGIVFYVKNAGAHCLCGMVPITIG